MEVGQYKIGAIIQARLGSTRLPNKVLMPIGNEGRTIISQIIFQLKMLQVIDKIVVATSVSKKNDVLETYVGTGPIFNFDQPVNTIGTNDSNDVSIPI